MEQEKQEVWYDLSHCPTFFLHILPDLKTHHYSFKAHFPCYSPSLRFSSHPVPSNDMPLCNNQVIELIDYGNLSYPTTLIENQITHRITSIFSQFQSDPTIILPCSTFLYLQIQQKKHITIRSIYIPLVFDQLDVPPALHCICPICIANR